MTSTEIYTLSLHDALPISLRRWAAAHGDASSAGVGARGAGRTRLGGLAGHVERIPAASPTVSTDRKSTRLNSSHPSISYAVFCLKKKKIKILLLPIISLQF